MSSREELIEELQRGREAENEYIRRLVLEDRRIDVLAERVLGYHWKDFHQLMWDFVEGRADVSRTGRAVYRKKPRASRRKFAMILAPRGWGKSTTMDVLAIVLEIITDPNIRILIGSKTDAQAKSFLSEIKQCLEHPRLVEIFGLQRGEKSKWDEHEIIVCRRTRILKEATITVVGAGGAVVSKHYDMIVGDDLVDEKNSQTDGQREIIKTFWYKTLLPTLEPHGIVRVLGTRYHYQDLYGHFMDNDEFFRGRARPGEAAEHFLRISSLNEEGKSNFEEKFSTEYLHALRRSMGTIIFDSQYQNDISRQKGDIFSYDMFRWYNAEDPVKFAQERDLFVWMAVDLAIGQKEQNDKFAICVVGVSADLKVYVLDYFTNKITYKQQTAQIAHFYDKYDPIRCGIEANAYQQAKIQDIREDAATADLRVVPIFTDTDKISRAWKLTAYFEREDIYFPKGRADELETQLLEFPNGKYKDLFDALDFAVTLGTVVRARRERNRAPGARPRESRTRKLGVL